MTEVPVATPDVVQTRPIEAVATGVKPKPAKEMTKLFQAKKADIEAFIKDPKTQTLLLVAGTGTGKTFAGSQIALEALPENGRMAVAENLRKVTEESPKTILEDRQRTHPNEKLGDVVGFQNRYRRKTSESTRLLFCPIKTLLNKMNRPGNHNLEEYDLIMVDEVHKESTDNQHLLEKLAEAQKKRAVTGRPLKVILTSATMDEVKLKGYFEGAQKIEVPGENIDVPPEFAKERVDRTQIPAAAAKKINESLATDEGNILVFLSGQSQIEQTQKAVIESLKLDPNTYAVVPYLGSLSKEEQDSVLTKNQGKRLIVLATNAAQEGLTWPIKVVIDGCTHKHLEFDPVTGQNYLVEKPAPLDHLIQRKGRVGRTAPQPGEKPDKYYALTTETDWRGRAQHETPDIVRTDLTSTVLTMLANGDNPYLHRYINKPPERHLDIAFRRLEKLGAVKDKKLTEKGKYMAGLELIPNHASLVVEGARLGAIEEACAVASMLEVYPEAFNTQNTTLLSYKDSLRSSKSDLVPLMKLLHSFAGVAKDKQAAWASERGMRLDRMRDALDLYSELTISSKQFTTDPNPAHLSREAALDVALQRSFGDISIEGVKKNRQKLVGVGGDAVLTIDKASSIANEKIIPPYISAKIKKIDKVDGRETRIATLNHALSAEAQLFIKDGGKTENAKPKVENNDSKANSSKSESLKDESPPLRPTKSEGSEGQAKGESPPPPKPLKWWQKVGNWFKGLFGRIFG